MHEESFKNGLKPELRTQKSCGRVTVIRGFRRRQREAEFLTSEYSEHTEVGVDLEAGAIKGVLGRTKGCGIKMIPLLPELLCWANRDQP